MNIQKGKKDGKDQTAKDVHKLADKLSSIKIIDKTQWNNCNSCNK